METVIQTRCGEEEDIKKLEEGSLEQEAHLEKTVKYGKINPNKKW